MFIICLSYLLIILYWILSAKNHIIFLAVSVQSLKYHSQQRNHALSLSTWHLNCYQLSIWLIFQTDSFYYFSFRFLQSAHLINQSNQLSLFSQACQLFSSISLLSHAQFSWFNFFWLEFSHSFSVIFLFDWSHSHIWDFDQIYYHKQLFCFVLCSSWEVFCLSLFFIVFCLLVWDFSQAFCYELLFNFMQHFWKRFFVHILKFQKYKFL